MANELSVELSYEDIRTAIVNFGFHIEVSRRLLTYFHSLTSHLSCSSSQTLCIFLLQVEKESVQTTYTENDRSMLRYIYDCVFFVARKPADLYFNGQDDDDQQKSSPPAAKSPRREDTDSLTWQEVLLTKTVNLEDWSKIRLTKRKRKWTQMKKKISGHTVSFFVIYIFMMHLMEKCAQLCRTCVFFLCDRLKYGSNCRM